MGEPVRWGAGADSSSPRWTDDLTVGPQLPFSILSSNNNHASIEDPTWRQPASLLARSPGSSDSATM